MAHRPETAMVLNARGLTESQNLTVLPACETSLDSRRDLSKLIDHCQQQQIEFIALDPLRRLTRHADQGPAEFAPLALALRRLQLETGAGVGLVHHDAESRASRPSGRRWEVPRAASGGGIFGITEAPVQVRRIDEIRTELTPAGYKVSDDSSTFTT